MNNRLIVFLKEFARHVINKLQYVFRYNDLKWLKKQFYPKASILSMNCFAGHIYQDLHWAYTSPTAGLFFYAEDFCNLVEDITILKRPVLFRDRSKWKSANDEMPHREHWYPIGYFEGTDIEIHFLHYRTEKEALEKWNRRVCRFNFNNFIAIGFQQNECTPEIVKRFVKSPVKNKVFFSNIDIQEKGVIYIDKFKEKESSPDPYKYVNDYYKYLVEYLKNNPIVS